MDVALFSRVLWRFRFLVAVGLLAAFALAVVGYARVEIVDGRPKLTYRQREVWASRTLLFVTQSGFPWGRSTPEAAVLRADARLHPDGVVPRFAQSGRFAGLAVIYSKFAVGDAVRRIMVREGPIDGGLEAAPAMAASGDPLPIIELTGLADTPAEAAEVSRRGTRALRRYVAAQQRSSGVAAEDRVVLTLLKSSDDAQLVSGRKLTLPILAFIAVAILTVATALMLENLMPRRRVAGRRLLTSQGAERPG
jgi:hypothetical protein